MQRAAGELGKASEAAAKTMKDAAEALDDAVKSLARVASTKKENR
jgi:hypothetical protein